MNVFSREKTVRQHPPCPCVCVYVCVYLHLITLLIINSASFGTNSCSFVFLFVFSSISLFSHFFCSCLLSFVYFSNAYSIRFHHHHHHVLLSIVWRNLHPIKHENKFYCFYLFLIQISSCLYG